MRWQCACEHINNGTDNTYPTHCSECGRYWMDGGYFIEGTDHIFPLPIPEATHNFIMTLKRLTAVISSAMGIPQKQK